MLLSLATPSKAENRKPHVRALTAFVRIDFPSLRRQILDAVGFLHRAQSSFHEAGYEVQTLRVTTQSFVEYIHLLSMGEVASFFRHLDELAKQQGITIAVGPAMRSNTDDPRAVDQLAEALSESKYLAGSVIMADASGVHANAIRAAAHAIVYLGLHSPHGQANFNFAATAMLPPYGPFFPGSYSAGADHQFSIALESANVVLKSFRLGQSFDSARSALEKQFGDAVLSAENIAEAVAGETSWSYAGIDVSPAPGEDASIGSAIERLTSAPFGSSGTLSAAALITSVLRRLPVKWATRV
jgi:uncharacterized protein (UPF0210 family)